MSNKFNDYFRKLFSGTQKSTDGTNPTETTAETKKTAENHVLSGKSAAKIHKENPYEKSAKDSELLGVYSDADELLKPKPLADDLKSINAILLAYIAFYSAFSVVSAAAIGYYGAEYVLTVTPDLAIISAIAAALAGLVLAGINEKFKIFGLNRYFKARQAQRNASLMPLIIITAAISIVISAGGGALISYNLTDKTAEIQTNQFSQIDSINSVFDSQLTALQLASESAQNTLKQHKTGWRANIARQDLDKTAAKISDLQTQKAASLGTLQTVTTSAISQDTGKREKYAKISAGIVTVLELLFVGFHALYWSNIRKIKTEKENHISVDSGPAIQFINPDTFANFGLAGLQLQNQNFAGISGQTNHRPIGFKTPIKTQSVNTQSVNTQSVTTGNRTCKHCNQLYTYGHAAQKYCAESCRIAAWELRTGRTVNKAKK